MSRRWCHLDFGSLADISGIERACCIIPLSIVRILFYAMFQISCSVGFTFLPVEQVQGTVIYPMVGGIVTFSWSSSKETNPNTSG